VRETEILVEQQPPHGVFVCDHAGRVINKLSLRERVAHHVLKLVELDGAVAVLVGPDKARTLVLVFEAHRLVYHSA